MTNILESIKFMWKNIAAAEVWTHDPMKNDCKFRIRNELSYEILHDFAK